MGYQDSSAGDNCVDGGSGGKKSIVIALFQYHDTETYPEPSKL